MGARFGGAVWRSGLVLVLCALSCRHAPRAEEPKPVEAAPAAPMLVLETDTSYDTWIPQGPRYVNPWDVPPDDVAPLGPAPRAAPDRPSADTEAAPTLELALPWAQRSTQTPEGWASSLLYRGWPLTLAVRLHQQVSYQDGEPTVLPSRVEARGGGWHQFIKLAVYPRELASKVADSQKQPAPTGASLAWPFRLVRAPSGPVALDGPEGDSLYLVLDAQETARLPPGHYEVMAWLDTRAGATDASWRGVLRSSQPLTVEDAPAALSEDLACVNARLEMEYFQALQDKARAAAALDAFLARHPQSKEMLCWEARAFLFEEAGQAEQAVKHYRRAIEAGWDREDDGDLGLHIQDQCTQLLDKVRGRARKNYLESFCTWPP